MKKNGHMNCDLGPWTCVLKDDADIQQAWAKYFSKYLDAYKRNKINIWGVTIQNEPEAQTGNLVYEGMHFTPSTEKAFLIDHLGPVMKADHPDVNVLIYDHNKDHIVEWAQTILGDPRVPNTYGVQHFIGTLVHTSKILQKRMSYFLNLNYCPQKLQVLNRHLALTMYLSIIRSIMEGKLLVI